MAIIQLKDKFGKPAAFTIKGDTPSQTEQARIDAILNGTQPPKPVAKSPDNEPGIMSQIGAGIGRGVNSMQAGVLTIGQGIAENSDSGTLFGMTVDDYQKAVDEQRKQGAEYGGVEGGFFDQDGVYDKTRFLAGVAGESAPASALGLGATAGGAALGAAIGGPFGAVVGGLGGALVSSLGYVPQAVDENAQAQIKEHGYIKDWDKLAAASAGSALLESAADNLTLRAASLLKMPVTKLLKEATERAVKKAGTEIAKRVGVAAATGMVSEAATEALQQMGTRWQAETALMSDEAKAEYLESAIVGGILGGTLGGALGGVGAVGEAKTRAAQDQAKEDALAESADMARRSSVNPEAHAAARAAPYDDRPFIDQVTNTTSAGALPDFSNQSTKEQAALGKEENQVPEDKALDLSMDDAVDADLNPPAAAEAFTEQEYQAAIKRFQDGKHVARDKIKNEMKMGRPKANAIFDEMLRRNDAVVGGPENKYLKVTVPKGMLTRKGSDTTGTMEGSAGREYMVQPVDDVNSKRYTVSIGDRQLKTKFRTEEEARASAERQGLPKFTINKDVSGQQYGIYELNYRNDKSGEQTLVGKRVVNTFPTQEEANAAARDMDPAYSPESQKWIKRLTEEQKAASIAQDVRKELGAFQEKLQATADKQVGKGRATVDVQPMVDAKYLQDRGFAAPPENSTIEGVMLPARDAVGRVVALSSDLYDPALPTAERQKKLDAVLNHELVHVMRDADLLTPKEWDALLDHALTQKVPGKQYTWMQRQEARHVGNPGMAMEEALAEMLRAYSADPTMFDKPTRNRIQKLMDFVKSLLRLGQKYDGEDVMKAIFGGDIASRPEGFGGLGKKGYPGNPLFSQVKVDPFYSKADEFFTNTKQEKAPKDQWMGMVKKSGIKPDELAWLDLENWFDAWAGKPIPRGEILDYIRASSLRPNEDWSGQMTAQALTPAEEKEVAALDVALPTLERKLRERFDGDVNQSYFQRLAEEGRTKWFDLMVSDYARDNDHEAMDFLNMKDRYLELANRGRPKKAAWQSYTQEGGDIYGTAAFYLPQGALSPEWEGNAHYEIPNVIAFTRFTQRTINDKKTLFIEEVQSDLHQSAARAGGYASAFAEQRLDALREERVQLFQEIDPLVEQIQDASHAVNLLFQQQAQFLEKLDIDAADAMGPEIAAARAFAQKLENQRARLSFKAKDMEKLIDQYEQRMWVPDAPLKSSWEDFVIKRLIRFAAENDFDQIAWHGEADSVAETEQYHTYKPVLEEAGRIESTLNRVGTGRNMRMAYERALEADDNVAAGSIQNLIDRVDEGEMVNEDVINAELTPEILDKYFPARNTGGLKHTVEGQNFNAIFNRYLEKLPRVAKQIGKKYGAVPVLFDPRGQASEGAGPINWNDYFESADDIFSFIATLDPNPELEGNLRAAAQIFRNQREPDMTAAMNKAGVTEEDVNAAMEGSDEFGAGLRGPSDMEFVPRTFDKHGNPNYKRWVMPLTDSLKKEAIERGFPVFSAVNTEPSTPGFAEGTVITVVPIGTADRFDGEIPAMPEAKFSGVSTNGAYEKMVMREIDRRGYNPFMKQRLAKARIYDKGMTPYGQPLENSEPAYAKKYIPWNRSTGPSPILGFIQSPVTNKNEPVVIQLGGDWRPQERGLAWPSGYGFNHSVWHHDQIAKDTNTPSDQKSMLQLFAQAITRGGEMTMDRGNMGIINATNPKWRKPLKIVLQRSIVDDPFFKKEPVWKFITAYTNDIGDVAYSAVSTLEGEAPRYSASAPMGQRVPLTPPANVLEQVEANTTYNNLVPRVQKLLGGLGFVSPELKQAAQSKAADTFIGLQDRMLSVGDLVDRVRKNGGFVSNENDTYLREQLMVGQIDDALQALKQSHYEPLLKAVKSLGITEADMNAARNITGSDPIHSTSQAFLNRYKSLSPDQTIAELYLYAQHAKERNAMMRKRNERLKADRPQQYDAGSGMTDADADAILGWMNSQRFASKLSDLSNPNSVRSRYRALISKTNDIRVKGQLTPDFRNMKRKDGTPVDPYEDYAPLRTPSNSMADEEEVDIEGDVRAFGKTGKGFRIMGKEDFSATGRQHLAGDLIAYAVLQNEEAVVRAGKNEVGLSFLKLIRDNAEIKDASDVAEVIESVPLKVIYDSKSGRARMAANNKFRDDPNVLTVKEGGKETYIKIKDPRVAKAMGQRSSLGNNGAGALMKYLLTINRFLAAVRTSYNPEFMIGNFLRDLEGAMVNVSENEVKGLRRQIITNILPALAGIRENMRGGTTNSQWAKDFAEFRKRGGMTAFYGIRELDDTIAKINTELAEDVGGSNLAKSWKAMKTVGQFIEDYNSVIENGVRVSTYKAMRDKMMAAGDPNDPAHVKRVQERAAFIAKNLTVNFNMGGDAKPMMNALYLFYNASMQGSMALVNPMLRSKRVRRIWAGVLAAGLMQDLLMNMLSPEDDDGISQYDKIPEFILEHNIIMMDPFGLSERGYFKIPIPYLMNGIYNAGRAMSAAARGKYTAGEAFNSIGGTMIDSLNPWAGTNNLLNFVAPTLVDPVVDLFLNNNFADEPIAPPESPYGVNEKASQRYWNNTSPAYVAIADWMSRITGSHGTFLPGVAEFSPNQYEYVFEWLGGGTLTFARRLNDFVNPVLGQGTLYEAMSGGDWSANDVPALRRFYGNISSRNDLQYYIENRDKVLAIRNELKEAAKSGDSEHYQDIILRYPNEYRIAAHINSLENARKKISRQINKVRDSKLPEDQKTAMVKTLKAQQEDLIGRANSYLRGTKE